LGGQKVRMMEQASGSRTRIRAAHRLSAVKVARTKEPGLYEDGAGLRLVVTPHGTKRWALRLTINGRRVERGLGVFPLVGLEDARRKAAKLRLAAREGRDAQADDKLQRQRTGSTFSDAFDTFFAVRRQQLANAKHIQQWQNTMRDYVLPRIGNLAVSEVTSADVLRVLEPIWFAKPETALRVLQRVNAIFDSAILRGFRERANPCIGVAGELGVDHRKSGHFAALPWRKIPDFVSDLRNGPARFVTKLAFEFLIHTVARSGEVRGARWQEIDIDNRMWTIPGSDRITGRRTKTGEIHDVPLSTRVTALLREARELHRGDLLFPSSTGRPLSDNTLSKLMRDAGRTGTPHGFRSAFKDWAAETGVRDEVSEAALAHADRNRVRAAYRRTRFLGERVALMERWSNFVVTGG
jgi:integrase